MKTFLTFGMAYFLSFCPSVMAEEYFHDVPAKWESEFRRVMKNLRTCLGEFDIDIVAWPSSDKAPFLDGKRVAGGQYVSGRRDGSGKDRIMMVLEIDVSELEGGHPHMLSVIAHEYFHVYQRLQNPSLNRGLSIKWLIEGSAAVFESMYLRDFEQVSDYAETAQLRHAKSSEFGAKMEEYENQEVNYGTSTAMVLSACKEFGFQRMVDFWKRQPSDENWKQIFEEIFGISVERFYEEGKGVPPSSLRVSDMGELGGGRF
ncbi:hypothetical protein N8612_00470 [Verrucomicrobia bacterium]|jgi:hypothetical protein|nr:hypothetical protein [Verrucomicrobiota bacterium]